MNKALAAFKLKQCIKLNGDLTYRQCIDGAYKASKSLAVTDPHDVMYVKLIETRDGLNQHAMLIAEAHGLKATDHLDLTHYLVDDKKAYVEEFIARVPRYTHARDLDKTIRMLFVEERSKTGVQYTGLERSKIEFLEL